MPKNFRRSTLTALLLASAGIVVSGCSAAAESDAPAVDASAAVTVTEENTTSSIRLTATAAATAARAALDACVANDLGFVSVAIVDRNGQLQAFLRGDNAAEHTIEAAQRKAYTAAAFGADTADLVERADQNDLHRLPGTLFMAGGVSVRIDNASIAGIGVGGAPSGMDDQACAAAGLAAIQDSL